MASKSGHDASTTSENIEELLDVVDKALDRVKTLYEQYFLGIQKQPPTFLHTDIERKLRDLTQLNIRNTGMRYRLATINQKFGSYNSYWRRTLRQIENGTYLRNLSKIGREAIRSGAEIPEEILAAMPKRMREQVVRDRDAAIAIARRRNLGEDVPDEDLLTLADDMQPPEADDVAAMISEPSQLRRDLKTRGGAHILNEADGDLDLSAFFAEVDALDSAPASAPAKPAQASGLRPQASGPAPEPKPQATRATGPQPAIHPVPTRATGPVQAIPATPTAPVAKPPSMQSTVQAVPVRPASSQNTKPISIVPGAAAARGPVPVESMAGPFPRAPTNPPTSATGPTVQAPAVPSRIPAVPTVPTKIPPVPPAAARPPVPGAPQRPMPPSGAATKPSAPPPPPMRPPPGMTDADVNTLYAKYVQAKQLVGEAAGPKEREKLLKTINAQAPKIMEQYKAKGVDFSVVVKDNQVIIRAKPKT